ncbi:hypothetical protein [Moorena producens]|uniref:hypothetical protein n=1 Tax=Moorena producens TaxID=1155739 RepID=UPI000A50B1E7|nr:hypothetical protein [Moorena producens]
MPTFQDPRTHSSTVPCSLFPVPCSQAFGGQIIEVIPFDHQSCPFAHPTTVIFPTPNT